MKFAAALASLAVVATAAPGGWGDWNKGNNGCPTRAYVQTLVDQERVFLMHTDLSAAQAAADAIFADDIQEYGDSINSLRMAPLGDIVETGKATYVTDTLSTPPIPQIDTLSLTVDCNQFVWQWRFYGIGPGPNEYIQGFTLIKLNSAGLINYQYVEFNSLAWAENSGYTVTPPTTGPFASGGGE
ncbi:hypothetical protein LTR70_004116 [Exophiala xenobiotica]|uniref:NTF2-like domain-containing protein n=1 Tax=Lithohypha guttulata TaxID=1690604 RepID=A0ABR0KEE3_9EURO|nr:hypothetical protein LTR24_003603 [Lithohypha guttulata]KAK5321561.1 hypothetical protein LTR70_004116 [Exophiala xenobiotica]